VPIKAREGNPPEKLAGWNVKFSGRVNARLKELEEENRRLKKMSAKERRKALGRHGAKKW
jgi:hypothetical protein